MLRPTVSDRPISQSFFLELIRKKQRAAAPVSARESSLMVAEESPQPAGDLPQGRRQMTMFDFVPESHPVLKEIAGLDLTAMTPLAALNELDRLQKIIRDQE